MHSLPAVTKTDFIQLKSFMQHATLHYMLLIENAIVYNWSYYASSTITRSMFAIMQEVVLTWGCDYPINIGAKSCLHQMMMMWFAYYCEGKQAGD